MNESFETHVSIWIMEIKTAEQTGKLESAKDCNPIQTATLLLRAEAQH